eukprot:COSAG01_NODE_71638_length_255_cov_0.666667_1_plen_24_part_01
MIERLETGDDWLRLCPRSVRPVPD